MYLIRNSAVPTRLPRMRKPWLAPSIAAFVLLAGFAFVLASRLPKGSAGPRGGVFDPPVRVAAAAPRDRDLSRALDRVQKALAALPAGRGKESANFALARAERTCGDRDAARSALDAVAESYRERGEEGFESWMELGHERVLSQDWAEARRTLALAVDFAIRRREDLSVKLDKLRGATADLLQAGDRPRVREILRYADRALSRLPEDSSKTFAECRLQALRAIAGDLQESLDAIIAIRDTDPMMEIFSAAALSDVADSVRGEDLETARPVLDRVFLTLPKISALDQRLQVLDTIAFSWAQVGNLAAALRLGDGMAGVAGPNPGDEARDAKRVDLFFRIAESYIDRGEFDQAMEVTVRIVEALERAGERSRIRRLSRLARIEAELGEPGAAAHVVKLVQLGRRPAVRRLIAAQFLRLGDAAAAAEQLREAELEAERILAQPPPPPGKRLYAMLTPGGKLQPLDAEESRTNAAVELVVIKALRGRAAEVESAITAQPEIDRERAGREIALSLALTQGLEKSVEWIEGLSTRSLAPAAAQGVARAAVLLRGAAHRSKNAKKLGRFTLNGTPTSASPGEDSN